MTHFKLRQFQVELAENSHPVYIGTDLFSQADVWPKPDKSKKAVVFLDQYLERHQEAICQGLTAAGWEPVCELLQGSEALKDLESIFPLYGKLLNHGLQRSSLLVAVGGGTIGDSIGFLASTYLRGIRWVSVPTTLLAQVDSGLGGKTGVNHPTGKNLIGSVWQPCSILCNISFLEQLSQRDMISGLGEVFKYGLIYDAQFWLWLIAHREDLMARKPEVLAEAVTRSLQIKAHYVQQDQYDSKGIRAALNFGHTFGHALEARAGYGQFRHGEAVIWGMRVASFASYQLGMLSPEDYHTIRDGLQDLPVPDLPQISSDDYLSALKFDKKSEGQYVQTLLLSAIGNLEIKSVTLEQWRGIIEDYQSNLICI